MKISPGQTTPTSHTHSNNLKNPKNPVRRKTRTPRLAGTPIGKRGSRPETPLLHYWKYEDKFTRDQSKDKSLPLVESDKKKCARRKVRTEPGSLPSARKLAAGLWRLTETVSASNGVKKSEDLLGLLQPGVSHVRFPVLRHRKSQPYKSETKELLQSPHSISGPKNGFMCKIELPFQFSNSAIEGATKWDPVCFKASNEISCFSDSIKPLEQQISAVSVISALEAELEQARTRIQELEAESKSSKKKLEHFLRKLSEEKASWRSREHEKIRAIIDDAKSEVSRERKNRQRMEIVNSKLVNELAEAKLSAKRLMQDCEKERKNRELMEEVCDELAKEIGEDKADYEALKRESIKVREEVEEERKMLQMAEVWREERVQMKLTDAKIAIEQKYTQMNRLVADVESFLRSKSASQDAQEMKEAEMLLQTAASINIQDIRDFSYEPSNPDDIFSVLEDVKFGKMSEREIDPCVVYSPASKTSKIQDVSPKVSAYGKDMIQRHLSGYEDEDGDIEEDGSGWETISQLEDQGSSYSTEGSSAPSVNKICRDNMSESGTEWEDNVDDQTPINEIREIIPARQSKKGSSISRLWRSHPNNGEFFKIISVDGMNGRISNGRKSNVSIKSLDQGSGKSGLSPHDLLGHWSSPDTTNAHISKGMKGCIEWPRGAQKNSLKSKLLEARIESQKVQLRQVLKQKI